MADKEVQELQMRIVELENQLKAITEARTPVDISADDVRAYRKVRDAVASDAACSGTPCGTSCIIHGCVADSACGGMPCGTSCIIHHCHVGGPAPAPVCYCNASKV